MIRVLVAAIKSIKNVVEDRDGSGHMCNIVLGILVDFYEISSNRLYTFSLKLCRSPHEREPTFSLGNHLTPYN
jgi:hypothetical protein